MNELHKFLATGSYSTLIIIVIYLLALVILYYCGGTFSKTISIAKKFALSAINNVRNLGLYMQLIRC